MTAAKPNVLIVTSLPYFQWRGSPIRLGFDVQALVDIGYRVDLLTIPIGMGNEINGATVHRVANPFNVKNIPIGPSFTKLIFDVFLLFRAIRLARKNHYAVVHGIEDTGIIAWVAACFSGSGVVFEKHSDPASYNNRPMRNLVMAVYKMVERFAMRRADVIIATGEGLCEQARRAAPGRPVFHIFDIPSSLVEPDPARAGKIRREIMQRPDEVLILYGGSFAIYQGIDLLFQSMPYVVTKHPQARFVVIGGNEQEITGRKTWLKKHGIEDRVTFLGNVHPDELPHYLAAADILLSPRKAGINTPLKLLDYLKAARPIVATDTESHRSIIDDSFAMIVDATAPAFSDGINWLIADEDSRLRFGAQGRRLIDDMYNFNEYKRRLGKAYNTLRETAKP
jgi:glycosyltransferase involved in cell wall biosynthesis